MRKIAFLTGLIILSIAYAQNPAQEVTIEGYTIPETSTPPADAFTTREMPANPNQAVDAPTSSKIGVGHQEEESDVATPSGPRDYRALPSPLEAPVNNSSNQPVGIPSAPNTVLQPVLPASAPLPPSVPTPDQPEEESVRLIQDNGATSDATPVTAPGEPTSTTNTLMTARQNQLSSTKVMINSSTGNTLSQSKDMNNSSTQALQNSAEKDMINSDIKSPLKSTNTLIDSGTQY